ncbi:uncharacterized protein LOC135351905 isoform X2 [Halichondria panicea]|uniref:uncharacterized protein LOC135351905 isoform X2 n=1 Tax=Halichondria panicea TaxID=6063 RepID=UPI00312B8F7A
MRIQILGCLADLDTVDVPQEPTQAVTEAEGTVAEGTVLATALPIALVTILVVAVIAIISVTCCYYFSRKNRGMKAMNMPEMNEDQTIKHVKNDLYHTSTNRRFADSTNSTAYMISRSPQPYEVARTGNQAEENNETGTASYETVNLEVMAERNRAPTKLESNKTEEGYETVGFETESDNTGKVTLPVYATVTVEDAHAVGEGAETNVTYSSVQNSQENGYLNMPPKTRSQLQEELGITESYGPERFQV